MRKQYHLRQSPAVQLAVDPAPDFVGVDEAALPYEDATGSPHV